MTKYRAYKFRLYPNAKQELLINKTLGCVRLIHNSLLDDKIAHFKKTKTDLAKSYSSYRGVYPWLSEVDSTALRNAQKNLDISFNRFMKGNLKAFPKHKRKHYSKASYKISNKQGRIRIEGNKLRMPKVGYVTIKKHREPPCNSALTFLTITKTSTNKYYASIVYLENNNPIKVKPKNVIGLDFSLKDLFITSNGESAGYPRFTRIAEQKISKQHRKVSKCEFKSNNYFKELLKLNKLNEKVANQRADFLHKKSANLANRYDLIFIEDLDLTKMSQKRNFGKSVHDVSWGIFLELLNYKMKEKGKYLIKIDKMFPSSKICSRCGNLNMDIQLFDREFYCICGFSCDRDLNAAINIKNRGIYLLRKNQKPK